VIGRIALRGISLAAGIAELTYWVLPAARGRGVAVRASDELARWALRELGLHRLELRHSVANTPSCRVAIKSRFRLEGTLRSALLHRTDGTTCICTHVSAMNDVYSGSLRGCRTYRDQGAQ
jgi:ribosomal-protein-alanine N-acetyltransferase